MAGPAPWHRERDIPLPKFASVSQSELSIMNFLFRALCAVVPIAFGVVSMAYAGVQIVGTRVIYPAGEREVTVRVLNSGTSARLLQAWTDSGDGAETAETSKAPFLVTPPISRVEAGQGQALRLMFTGGDTLAQDRESVYWLNVVEIPPKPADASDRNYLQFAVRSRIKILYRPATLAGDPVASISLLGWRVANEAGRKVLECTNSTAYNVSFADVRLKGAPDRVDEVASGGMCPAKGRGTFVLHGGVDSGRLTYKAINDYGAFIEGEAAYTR